MMSVRDTEVTFPNETHPAYADSQFLKDWLNRIGQFADKGVIFYPILAPLRATFTEKNEAPQEPFIRKHTFLRHKAWGLAPYTGDPFVYRWNFAADELGRGVAGDVWIEYYNE